MAILVTDGNQRSTLALVRALGRAGVTVTVGECRPSSLAGNSRYCANTVCYPSPLEGEERFLAFLREILERRQHRVLLPMTDVTLQAVARARGTLTPLVEVPLPEWKQVTILQDKRQTLLLARQAGLSYPQTFLLHDNERVEDVAHTICYPAVIKPRFSWFLRDAQWFAGRVQYARNPSELIAKYQQSHLLIPYPLVQERIEGEGRGVFLLVWDGELKAAFCHRRLREKPPSGGVSVYCESVPLDEVLVEKSFALLRSVGWQGVAMAEFKIDRRDGEAKLIEVNGRFWGSLQLCMDAGINFPLMLYRLATGERISSQFNYRVGVKSRWLLGDLDHLLIRLTRSRELHGTGTPGVSKVGALLNFLKLYERDMHYEVLRLDDPYPGWTEMKTYLVDACRSLVQRRKRTSDH